jgi:hypothetical protein
MATEISEDDPKHNLSAEVRTRLKQLDIILNNLRSALDVIHRDPHELERVNRGCTDR